LQIADFGLRIEKAAVRNPCLFSNDASVEPQRLKDAKKDFWKEVFDLKPFFAPLRLCGSRKA
jgi:hypothetical protein